VGVGVEEQPASQETARTMRSSFFIETFLVQFELWDN
jgi:hypothetical protein